MNSSDEECTWTTRANIVQLDYVGSLMHFSKFKCRYFYDISDRLAADCLTVLKMPELQIV